MIFELEPLYRDKNGHLTQNYRAEDCYLKLGELFVRAHVYASVIDQAYSENNIGAAINAANDEAKRLLELMTACATRLHNLPLKKGTLEQLQQEIIKANDACGLLLPKEERHV